VELSDWAEPDPAHNYLCLDIADRARYHPADDEQGKLVRRKSLSIKWHVAIVGLLVVAPLLLVEGILLQRIAKSERETLERSATLLAREVRDTVDRELQAGKSALLALGTSPHLETANYEEFYHQAQRVAETFPGSLIGLRNANGALLAVTVVPWGTPLPATLDAVLKEADEKAIATRSTVVTDLYTGAVTGAKFINIELPVFRTDATFVLSLALRPDYISQVIQTKSIGPAWVVGVTDKNHRLIARSRDQERFVGQRATDDFIANTQGVEGGFLGKTLDGVPVLNAYVRSSLSGWRIVAGVPLATLEAPLRRSYLLLASMAAAGLLASFGLAFAYSRYLTGPVAALQELAANGAAGKPVVPFVTGIKELDAVSLALARAFDEIARREKEQGVLINELNHRVKNTLATVQAMANVTLKRSASLQDFITSFTMRLSALAGSHDALTEKQWSGASLKVLLLNAARPFCDQSRLRMVEEDVELSAPMAVPFGMIFHELFTNAAKYGALSNSDGYITVTWSVAHDDGKSKLHLIWQEHNGPAVDIPQRKGFGTILIEGVASDLGGRVDVDYDPRGLVLKTVVPLPSPRDGMNLL
jgi:two-component sensor histidine kinase